MGWIRLRGSNLPPSELPKSRCVAQSWGMIGSHKGRAGLTPRPGSSAQCCMHSFWTGGSPSTPHTQALSGPGLLPLLLCWAAVALTREDTAVVQWALFRHAQPLSTVQCWCCDLQEGPRLLWGPIYRSEGTLLSGHYVLPVGRGPSLHTRQAHVLQLSQDEDGEKNKSEEKPVLIQN